MSIIFRLLRQFCRISWIMHSIACMCVFSTVGGYVIKYIFYAIYQGEVPANGVVMRFSADDIGADNCAARGSIPRGAARRPHPPLVKPLNYPQNQKHPQRHTTSRITHCYIVINLFFEAIDILPVSREIAAKSLPQPKQQADLG